MKTTIIYDNTVFRKDLKADWGFAALIEAWGKTILFDTGGRGSILLSNMDKLGIDPRAIENVFISHAHYDHTGGLSAFLDRNSDVKVWVPPSFRGVKNVDVVKVEQSVRLYEGIHSTGELEGIEQSLGIETINGIVIVAGCSHPRMEHILAAASEFGPVHGIIGGPHGTRPESLENLGLIGATHCTQHQREMKALYPESFAPGGAGRVIEIPDGASED